MAALTEAARLLDRVQARTPMVREFKVCGAREGRERITVPPEDGL